MMADEDARDMEKGIHFPHKITAAIFVRMGIEIEEHQYVPYFASFVTN